MHKTNLQIKWSSFMYPTILNVVKHGKRVKQSKTTYLVKFK